MTHLSKMIYIFYKIVNVNFNIIAYDDQRA